MVNNIMYTPSSIISGIDLRLSAEITILSEYTENGNKYRELYFPGREVAGKRTKAYGVFCCPESVKSAPLLLIIGNNAQSIDKELISYYAGHGFSVFMFDYLGETEDTAKHTFYPQEIEYANFAKAGRHLNYVDTNARETSCFEWLTLASYALSAALAMEEAEGEKAGVLGIGLGGNIAWMLSALDKRIAVSATVFSAGWFEYLGEYKYSAEKSAHEMTEERERWIAGLSIQAYAKYISAPMMFISCSNNKMTDMDRAHDTLNRIPPEVEVFTYFAPRKGNVVGKAGGENTVLLFKKYLAGEDVFLPQKLVGPEEGEQVKSCIVTSEEGVAKITLKLNVENVKSYRLYYSEGQVNPSARNWLEPEKYPPLAPEISIYPALKYTDKLLFVYANITYKNGFITSTPLCVKDLSKIELNELPAQRRVPVIYNSSTGLDTFTVFFPKKPSYKEILLQEYQISVKPGPGNISGITSNYKNAATYKISDSIYKGEEEESFKFDVYSQLPQRITVYFTDNAGTAGEHFHSYELSLLGGEMWQPVEVKKQNLKTADGQILKSWKDTGMVGFLTEEEALINNLIWI